MIIKDLDRDLLYLLGHLDEYRKQPGDEIFPGDEVAITGTTGWSTGEHLHLEVRVCDRIKWYDVLDDTKNQQHPGKQFGWHPQDEEPPRVNPFDHSETYRYRYWEHE
mgnify:CR=1 FL=1